MSLGKIAASILGNTSLRKHKIPGRGGIRAGEGVIRAGESRIRTGQNF